MDKTGWPDGTRVKFTAHAKVEMQEKRGTDHPLRTPRGGADAIYTIDNTKDSLHDVILRENGERWGTYWLEAEGREGS